MTLLTSPPGLSRVSGTAGLVPAALIPGKHKSKKKKKHLLTGGGGKTEEDEGQIITLFSAQRFSYPQDLIHINYKLYKEGKSLNGTHAPSPWLRTNPAG